MPTAQSSPSPSHLPTDSLLIIAELAKGLNWSRNREPTFCPGQDLNPKPLFWQFSSLTTRPLRTPEVVHDSSSTIMKHRSRGGSRKLNGHSSSKMVERPASLKFYHIFEMLSSLRLWLKIQVEFIISQCQGFSGSTASMANRVTFKDTSNQHHKKSFIALMFRHANPFCGEH